MLKHIQEVLAILVLSIFFLILMVTLIDKLAPVSPRYFVDPATNCHYVINPNGGITLRLQSDGQQVCLGK